MKILITGANGYLGKNLIEHLFGRYEIIATARNSEVLNQKCTLINLSNGDWQTKIKSIQPDVIINTVTCYGRKGESLSSIVDSNINFPLSLLELVAPAKSLFINCGTSLPMDVSPYAATKNLFSQLAEAQTKRSSGRFLDLKLEHFYGPYDNDDKFTSMVIRSCKAGRELSLTAGVQRRDFIYITDLLHAFDTILSNLNKFESFDSISIGSGQAITIREFVQTVAKVTNSKSSLRFGATESRKHEVMLSCADITRLAQLGWRTEYSLENAIAEIVSKENL
ncbi:NAD(P)-dependent oxidoreductase [Kosakonia sacchari]|uniref:NAD-dependent epimerase/dehydratase family protein n=1 Tax=Kosakonia sacchari TaxID=1158459 RepID=UPI002ACD5C3B|nr:NAD(P)-dependent oxidoreductase [Kosakonia sacchari]MDZ7324866.1 NAD(P)-dependent oxidoreductase [Kosakonia sacchari]